MDVELPITFCLLLPSHEFSFLIFPVCPGSPITYRSLLHTWLCSFFHQQLHFDAATSTPLMITFFRGWNCNVSFWVFVVVVPLVVGNFILFLLHLLSSQRVTRAVCSRQSLNTEWFLTFTREGCNAGARHPCPIFRVVRALIHAEPVVARHGNEWMNEHPAAVPFNYRAAYCWYSMSGCLARRVAQRVPYAVAMCVIVPPFSMRIYACTRKCNIVGVTCNE